MTYNVDEATQVVMAEMPDRAVIYADVAQLALAGRVLANEVKRLQKEMILFSLITKERNDYRLVIQEMQGHGGGDDPDLWACLVDQRDDLARALFRIRSLTMRGKGDKQVADIACGAVLSIDETPLFEVAGAEPTEKPPG